MVLIRSDNDIYTVRDLIDQMAGAKPDGTFLISPETGQRLTFKGLQGQAEILSASLLRRGLARGDKIAFLMDNGLFTAQLFLGAMYGGFVTVPLSVRAGVSQLAFTLEHCDAKVVFVGEPYIALLRDVLAEVHVRIEIISVGNESSAVSNDCVSNSGPLPTIGPGDPALLMYTSRSTGRPKGAVHTHKSVLAHGRNFYSFPSVDHDGSVFTGSPALSHKR
jgi:acyl-CoA synthetase (AMP-forming)/AMP-acid ligase II